MSYARVALLPEGNETLPDFTGAFRFSEVAPGDHFVMVSKTGFAPVDGHEDSHAVSLTVSLEKYTLGLTPLPSIRGRITGDGGEPVEGATVLTVCNPGWRPGLGKAGCSQDWLPHQIIAGTSASQSCMPCNAFHSRPIQAAGSLGTAARKRA